VQVRIVSTEQYAHTYNTPTMTDDALRHCSNANRNEMHITGKEKEKKENGGELTVGGIMMNK
jgi:hypothetical protein